MLGDEFADGQQSRPPSLALPFGYNHQLWLHHQPFPASVALPSLRSVAAGTCVSPECSVRFAHPRLTGAHGHADRLRPNGRGIMSPLATQSSGRARTRQHVSGRIKPPSWPCKRRALHCGRVPAPWVLRLLRATTTGGLKPLCPVAPPASGVQRKAAAHYPCSPTGQAHVAKAESLGASHNAAFRPKHVASWHARRQLVLSSL
jgi:hypothetical protein